MTLSANQHKAIAIIMFLSLTVFLRLGSGEIQPNDEGINAMSAKSIIETGNRDKPFDESIDKYASSTSVLTVWLIAGSMYILGETEFSVRLFSALSSAMALAFFYLISRRFLTYSSSIISLFLLSGTIAWNNYARQATSDVTAIAFILASLFFILKTLESEEKRQMNIYTLLFSFSLICSLMTNLFISFLPLVFVGFSFGNKSKKKQNNFLLLGCLLAVVLASLIYLLILAKNDSILLNNYNNIKSFFNFSHINILNYINQIIISNPFFLFGLLYLFIAFKKINKLSGNTEHEKYLNNILTGWFLFGFIVLTYTLQIHSNYILYFIPPAILISLKLFDNIHLIINSNRIVWIIFTLLIAFFLWSFIFELRQEVELLILGKNQSFFALLFIIVIVSSILGAFLLPKKLLDKISAPDLYYSITIIPYIMIFKVILLNLAVPTGDSFGAVKTADVLNSADSKSFIYLYHDNISDDIINTQLDWYTDGWLSGRRQGRTYVPLSMPVDFVDYENLRKTDEFPDLFIVYYVHPDYSVKSAVMKDLLLTRSIISKKNNYIIFGRKNSERNLDLPI